MLHLDPLTISADLVVVLGGGLAVVRAAWRMVHALERLQRETTAKLAELDRRVGSLELSRRRGA